VKKNVVVVGGGIAGLAASIYLARGGRTVTLFEKRRYLGGRGITHLRHGFRFNLGPHTVFRKGAGRTVYRELGIAIRGGRASAHGVALLGSEQFRLPASPLALLFTSMLTLGGKLEAASLLWRIRSIDATPFASITIREWLDANVVDGRLRLVMEGLVRLSTFSSDLGQSAASALDQMRLLLRGFVYIDEGWQKIVDALHSNAVTAGVNFITSSRVIAVKHDDQVRGIEIGGLEAEQRDTTLEYIRPDPAPKNVKGTPLPADAVLLAVDPTTARELVGDSEFSNAWRDLKPVTAACLDLAMSKLPQPKRTFVLPVDRPLYFGVHSAHAQLTPQGGAMVHVAKYQSNVAVADEDGYDDEIVRLNDTTRSDEQELEGLLDEVQPGWREFVVHRRFLPSMRVSNALVTPGATRPSPATPVRGLYLAGDWVAAEGSMADAALSSARAAAKAILGSSE
jgi:phytoene dehydrogenase-like protein